MVSNFVSIGNSYCNISKYRSEWPRGLRHELSSPFQTLEVVGLNSTRDMLVCLFSLCFIVLCVRSGFATPRSPV
jgi:hypothetical protein